MVEIFDINAARWYAVRVRSRCEKSAATYLAVRGLEVCSAVVEQRRVWSDRIQVVDAPLFPGYIFTRFGRMDRVDVLKAPGIAGIVGFGAADCPVEDVEMQSLQTLLRSGGELQRSPFLSVGTPVRVSGGAFRDTIGILQQLKSGHRLVVSISLLQRSISVEIDDAMVEPLTRPQIRGAA